MDNISNGQITSSSIATTNEATSNSQLPRGSPIKTDRGEGSLFGSDEGILIAKRPSWVVLIPQISLISLFTLLLSGASYILLITFTFQPILFLASVIFAFSIASVIALKVIVDWYFHIYFLTDKKIIELSYSPLFSYKVNGISLSQVRCTEVDAKSEGILSELLNMGQIIITFDRPTHQEEFVMQNIKHPRQTAVFINEKLDQIYSSLANAAKTTWLANKNGKSPYRFIDEYMPSLN